jgi:hypothetical protein
MPRKPRTKKPPAPKAKAVPVVKPLNWDNEGREALALSLEDFKKNISQLVHYPTPADQQIIEFTMLPAITLHWTDLDPVWCMVIGAPSSGKTLHLSLLQNWDKALFIDNLSAKALISGYRDEDNKDEDMSLLPKLDGKVFTIKDMTCLMEGRSDELHAVLGQLRSAYDGTLSKANGMIGLQSYESRFNMLTAVTPVIDRYYSVLSQLGERFICRREHSEARIQIVESVIHSIVTDTKTKAEWGSISAQFIKLINSIPKIRVCHLDWGPDILSKIKVGADFAALARSHVPRDRSGRDVQAIAAPEVGARLAIELIQCIAGYCIIHGILTPNREAWLFGGARILRDTLPMSVTAVLYSLYKLHTTRMTASEIPLVDKKEIVSLTRLSVTAIDNILTNFYLHGIIGKLYSGQTLRYYLEEKTLKTINDLELFHDFSELYDLPMSEPNYIKGA